MIDPLAVPAMALADFGLSVTVTPVGGGPPYPLTVLLSPATEEATLGQAAGVVATHEFRCLPANDGALAEGDLLTLDSGETFAAFEIVLTPTLMTRIRVVER